MYERRKQRDALLWGAAGLATAMLACWVLWSAATNAELAAATNAELAAATNAEVAAATNAELAAATNAELTPATNADALYAPALVADLFSPDTMLAWSLPPANCLFPDIVIQSLIHPFGLPVQLAIFAQYAAFFASMAAALALVLYICVRQAALAVLLSVLSLTFFAALGPIRIETLWMLWRPAHHRGAILCGLLILWLTLGIFVRGERAAGWHYGALAALITLSVFSDSIVILQFLGPVAVMILVGHRFQFISSRMLYRFAGTAAAAGAGFVILRMLVYRTGYFHAGGLGAGGLGIRLSPEAVRKAATRFVADLPELITSGWSVPRSTIVILWIAAILALLARQAPAVLARRRAVPYASSDTDFISLFFLGFCLLAWVATLAGPILLGMWSDLSHQRWLLPAILLPFFLLMPVAQMIGRKVFVGMAAVLFLVSLAATALRYQTTGLDFDPAVFRLRARPVQERLLALAQENGGPIYGFSDYWNAKYVNFLSGGTVRASALTKEGIPYLWISNASWFFETVEGRLTLPDYRFVLTDRLMEEKIIEVFGPPSAVETFDDGSRIFLYAPGTLRRSVLSKRLLNQITQHGFTHLRERALPALTAAD